MSDKTQVIVVGAGPTGLLLACALAERHVAVRIFEKRAGRSVHSKALVLQPRTLETLAFMGIADRFVERGHPVPGLQLVFGGRPRFSSPFPEVASRFRTPLLLRQQHTEEILEQRLNELGVTVERHCEVTKIDVDDDGAHIQVTPNQGEAFAVDAEYLCGCDGAHSTVRKSCDIGFSGKTYASDFIQTDCRVQWRFGYERAVGFFLDDGVLACLPLGDGLFRFIAVRRQARKRDAAPELSEFESLVRRYADADATLSAPEWCVHFRLHEKIAAQFVFKNRVVLLGDAAHIHTPAGGQGMNTGLQEAHNLAWKLDLMLSGYAPSSLLESFHNERWPIAAETLKFTDRLFTIALGQSDWVLRLRKFVVPFFIRQRWLFRRVFNRVAQLDVALGTSHIVDSTTARAHAFAAPGERMPDGTIRVLTASDADDKTTLHALFAHDGHTFLRFGDGAPALPADDALAHRTFTVAAHDAPDLRAYAGATVVVRPDGVIGAVCDQADGLARYTARLRSAG